MNRITAGIVLYIIIVGFEVLPVSFASGDHPHTEAISLWTKRGELFMEYQTPVAGKPARFTAHLTELAEFHAVTKASVTARLWKGQGPKFEGRVDGPARPGIFQPVVTVPEPGDYQGEVVVDGMPRSVSGRILSIIDHWELQSEKRSGGRRTPPSWPSSSVSCSVTAG